MCWILINLYSVCRSIFYHQLLLSIQCIHYSSSSWYLHSLIYINTCTGSLLRFMTFNLHIVCPCILYHNKRFLLISNINESMWYSLSILRAIGLYNQIEFSPDDVITLLISIYPFICCQYLSWHANQVKLLNIHLCTCIFTANVVY